MNSPSSKGKVSLMAWIDPCIRDYARQAAKDFGIPFSKLVEEACRLYVLDLTVKRAIEHINGGGDGES